MGGLSVAIAVLVLRVCLGPWGGVGLIHWSGLRRGTLGFWEGVGLVEGAGKRTQKFYLQSTKKNQIISRIGFR